MIDWMWQAWYDSMAAAEAMPLHVAAEAIADEPIPALRLTQDTGCACPRDVMCLTLEREAGLEQGEHVVSWTGWPPDRISQVRVGGVAAATVDVRSGD